MYIVIFILKDGSRSIHGPFVTEKRCENYAAAYEKPDELAAVEIEPLVIPFNN